MSLPNNFPLTQQQLDGVKSRLTAVQGYAGMGVAGPMRDLQKVLPALEWCIQKWGLWQSQKATAQTQNTVLKQYMTAAEGVLASYAAGNWDGGTAATQLINNMPQV